MSVLRYRTRGGSSPNGKARVYFCSHPLDHQLYFEEISGDILELLNCAVFYRDPEDPSQGDAPGQGASADDAAFDLAQMNLFVVPVSSRMLSEENGQADLELDIAREKRIPILPLMQESGLDAAFSRKFGNLQYLDKYASDNTAIPFREKLGNFLNAVILGDELAQKVRDAFDAYIFLSYRKKDRQYAQKLMELIHRNSFARDVAIWYDEFLTPGEDFNEMISEALKKSSLFVLAVTPNIVNEINYIMNIEYPMAVDQGKPVAPVEMVRTDPGELKRHYKGIPDAVDAENGDALAALLREKLASIKLSEGGDARHRFFMGLAYLSGIDVERNADRALELLRSAADEGLDEAMEKLSDIYYYGDGAGQDYAEALKWKKRQDDKYGERADASREDDDLYDLIKRRMRYGEMAYDAGVYDQAKWAFDVCYDAAKQLAFGSVKKNPFAKVFGIAKKVTGHGKYFREACFMMVRCCRYMMDVYASMGMADKAAEYGKKAANTGNAAEELFGDDAIRSELMHISSRMGELCLDSGNVQGAGDWFVKQTDLFREGTSYQDRLDEIDMYIHQSLYYQATGDLKEAENSGIDAYQRLEKMYEEYKDRLLLEKHLKHILYLCGIYEELGDTGGAAEGLDMAMDCILKARETGRDKALLDRYENLVYMHRGSVLMKTGKGDPLAQMERGIGYFEEISGSDASAEGAEHVIYAFTLMAKYFSTKGDDLKAVEWYEKAARFMNDTVSFTRSIKDIKATAEVYDKLFDVNITAGNGAQARKYYELGEYMLDAAAKSTGSETDFRALAAFRAKKTKLSGIEKTPEGVTCLLTWIARGDKALDSDYPDVTAALESQLGALCRDFRTSHKDFKGSRDISDLGWLLRGDSQHFSQMKPQQMETEKRSLCGKVTQSIIDSYYPFLKYDEQANLLCAYCGLYEIRNTAHVIGGKDKALKDFGNFYYGIPFWYFDIGKIEYPELWRLVYRYFSMN